MRMNKILLLFLFITFHYTMATASESDNDSSKLLIRKTTDFKVSGEGKAPNWNKTEWTTITVQENTSTKAPATRVKVLYSETGIYFLFVCEDEKLTATIQKDFGPLYTEDVVEVFLWPDESVPVYFEYEVSPFNYELPILVPNIEGRFQGWAPWHYEGERKVQHATSVQGGEKKSGSPIKSWTAEFFIPFDLLRPLVPAIPKTGTEWRANLYRIDYDNGYTTWTWRKTTHGANANFHEFKKFGTFVFE